jgi:hypothetical protein
VVAGFFVLTRGAPSELPPVLVVEDGDLVYTYHRLSGTEALFEKKVDPRQLHNLARLRPDDATALRLKLAMKLGVADLRELTEPRTDDLRNHLVSLGYLR